MKFYFHEISILYFAIFAVKSCGSWPLSLSCGILWISNLEHSFVFLDPVDLGSLKCFPVVGPWGSRILWILDPKFVFHPRILEILDLDVLVLKWDPGDPGS